MIGVSRPRRTRQEDEKYLTLASIIPMQSVLREKTTAYLKNPANQGYGQTFAKNMLASLEDRFGHHPGRGGERRMPKVHGKGKLLLSHNFI